MTRLLYLCLLLLSALPAVAHRTGGATGEPSDTLTVREGAEIIYQARNLIGELEDLMNVVTNAAVGPAQTKDLITNSYTDGRNQIFADKDVIIENDLVPDADAEAYRDDEVTKYLQMLSLYYEKGDEPTITLDNREASSVKRKDFYYVRVYFERTYEGTHRQYPDKTYETLGRVADIRADRVDNRWQTRILSIGFHRPGDSIGNPTNDVVLIDDESDGTLTASAQGNLSPAMMQEQIAETLKSYMKQLEEQGTREQKRQDQEYETAIAEGDKAYEAKDFVLARDAYEAALAVYPYKYHPKMRLNEIIRAAEQTDRYDEAIHRAELAQDLRQYDVALQYYQEALRERPDRKPELSATVEGLSATIRDLSIPNSKIMAGDHKEAIKDLDKLIKANQAQPQKRPELFVLRGRAYEATGKNKQALKDYQTAISYDSRYADAYVAHAKLLEKEGNLYEAMADWDVVISLDATNAAYLAERATLKQRLDDPAGALEDYRRAVAQAPENIEYLITKGQLHYDREEYGKALIDFARAQGIDETSSEAHFEHGRAALRLNKIDEAATDFAAARKHGVDDATKQIMIAEVRSLTEAAEQSWIRQSRLDAVRQQRDALMVGPDYAPGWRRLAKMYTSLGDFDQAEEAQTRAIDLTADAADYYQRAQVRRRGNRLREATQDLRQAKQRAPNMYDATVALGEVLAAQNDHTTAIHEFESTLERMKDRRKEDNFSDYDARRSAVYTKIARSRLAKGDVKEAMESLDEALSLDKENGAAYYQRAVVHHGQGDFKDALSDFEKALELKHDPTATYYARAMVHYDDGAYEKSAEDLTRVITATDLERFPETALHRARCYFHLNDMQSAETDLEAYLGKIGIPTAPAVTLQGWLRLDRNQSGDATNCFKQAIEADPHHASAWLGKASVSARNGETAKAVEQCEEALSKSDFDAQMLATARKRYLTSLAKDKAFKKLLKKYDIK
ncbi:MAG: tetratricopeptide repeat protein [Catalinimonas sp.]